MCELGDFTLKTVPSRYAELGDLGEGIDDAAPTPADGDTEKAEPGRRTSFYGITTTRKRIVYVVDISRSMDSPADARPTVSDGTSNPF